MTTGESVTLTISRVVRKPLKRYKTILRDIGEVPMSNKHAGNL